MKNPWIRCCGLLGLVLVGAGGLAPAAFAQADGQATERKGRNGTITKVSGDGTVVIDRGTRHGVASGAMFNIYAPSKKVYIPLTNKVTYIQAEAVAKVKVTRVDKGSSTGTLTWVAAGAQLEPGLEAVYIGTGDRPGPDELPPVTQLVLQSSAKKASVGRPIKLNAVPAGAKAAAKPRGPGIMGVTAVYRWSASGGILAETATVLPENEWYAPLKTGTYTITCELTPIVGGAPLRASVKLEGLGREQASPPRNMVTARVIGEEVFAGKSLRVSNLSFAPDGTALLLDAGAGRVFRLSPRGGLSPLITEDAGRLRQPVAAVAYNGHHYVLDRKQRRVKMYRAESSGKVAGKFVREFGEGARLNDVIDLAISTQGMIYVLDRGEYNVALFDQDGYLGKFGGKGDVKQREFLAPVALDADRSGNIWVLDAKRRDVQGFDPYTRNAGEIIKLKLETESGEAEPLDLAFAPDGNSFYVLTRDPVGIWRFDKKGGLLLSSLQKKSAFRDLPKRAQRLAVDPHGRVYVAGAKLPHVLRYSATGTYLGRFGGEDLGGALDIAAAGNGMGFVLDKKAPYVLRFDAAGWFRGRGPETSRKNKKNKKDKTEVRRLGRLVANPWQGANQKGGDVKLYALESGGTHVYWLDSEASYIQTKGGRGDAAGQFRKPVDIAAGLDGLLGVLDRTLLKITLFRSDGSPPAPKPFSRGKQEHELLEPYRLALDPMGDKIYIYDKKRFAIKKFDANMGFVASFGKYGKAEGQFMDVVRLAVSPSGLLWVADRKRGDLQLVDLRHNQFKHVLTFKPPDLDGKILAMAVDPTGHLHVLTDDETIHVYRPEY